MDEIIQILKTIKNTIAVGKILNSHVDKLNEVIGYLENKKILLEGITEQPLGKIEFVPESGISIVIEKMEVNMNSYTPPMYSGE